jgi:enamine deaminase RidA (YjgF/YER057c/UK114 family)
MTVTLITPDGLPHPGLYHQAAIASGSRIVFLAGQVAVDEAGQHVGAGDLAAQVEQCYRNVATALRGAGASFDDVAKLTAYVVDWTPGKMHQLVDGIARAGAALGTTHAPPLTGIGVSALADPAFLVEIDAVAVIA